MKSKILLGFFVLGLNLGVFAETPPVLPAPITLEPHPIICYGCCGHPIPPAPAPQPRVMQEVCEDIIFEVVETLPTFPGGNSALQEFIRENMQYPEIALELEIQGRVTLQFVVERDGSITDIVVVRGVDPLDKEAVRIVSEMPKWIPGKQLGIPVQTRFTMPIFFNIERWLEWQAQNEE